MARKRIEIRVRTPNSIEQVPLQADAELPAGLLLDFHIVEDGEIIRSSEHLVDLLEPPPALRQSIRKGFFSRFAR